MMLRTLSLVFTILLGGCMSTKDMYPYTYPLGHTTLWGSPETNEFYHSKLPHERRERFVNPPNTLPTPPQFNIWVDIFEKEMKK